MKLGELLNTIRGYTMVGIKVMGDNTPLVLHNITFHDDFIKEISEDPNCNKIMNKEVCGIQLCYNISTPYLIIDIGFWEE